MTGGENHLRGPEPKSFSDDEKTHYAEHGFFGDDPEIDIATGRTIVAKPQANPEVALDHEIAKIAKNRPEPHDRVQEIAMTEKYLEEMEETEKHLAELVDTTDNHDLRLIIQNDLDNIRARIDNPNLVPLNERTQTARRYSADLGRFRDLVQEENIKSRIHSIGAGAPTVESTPAMPASLTEAEHGQLIGEEPEKTVADLSARRQARQKPAGNRSVIERVTGAVRKVAAVAAGLFVFFGGPRDTEAQKHQPTEAEAPALIESEEPASQNFESAEVIHASLEDIKKNGLYHYLPPKSKIFLINVAALASAELEKNEPEKALPGHTDPENVTTAKKRAEFGKREISQMIPAGEIIKITTSGVEKQYSPSEWARMLEIARAKGIVGHSKDPKINEAEIILQLTEMYNHGKTMEFPELDSIIERNLKFSLHYKTPENKHKVLEIDTDNFQSGRSDRAGMVTRQTPTIKEITRGTDFTPVSPHPRGPISELQPLDLEVSSASASSIARAEEPVTSPKLTKQRTEADAAMAKINSNKETPETAVAEKKPAPSPEDELIPLVPLTKESPTFENITGGDVINKQWLTKTKRDIRKLGVKKELEKQLIADAEKTTSLDDAADLSEAITFANKIDNLNVSADKDEAEATAAEVRQYLSEHSYNYKYLLNHPLVKQVVKDLKKRNYAKSRLINPIFESNANDQS